MTQKINIVKQVNILPMQFIRLDSCRACGIKTSVKEWCKQCGVPSKLECKNCYKWVDDPPHDCKLFE